MIYNRVENKGNERKIEMNNQNMREREKLHKKYGQ